ncbi:MAG: hypothetical protein HY088_00875 [Ignavibacteriales bacterium]|nr:hypothetical protein [Ignavibacteriales bacterium]
MDPANFHPSQKNRATNPFRKRLAWWIEPGAIILLFILVVGGTVVVSLALDTGAPNAAIIFGIFWCIIIVVLMKLYKKSLYETGVYVSESTIKKTKEDVLQHRAKVQKEFRETELTVLERGEKTPVFDHWKLQSSVQKLHHYLLNVELAEIDPSAKELHLRVQRAELSVSKQFESKLLADVLKFFQVISQDSQFKVLEKYFEGIILELYSLRENESGRDESFPFFSIFLKKPDLQKLASTGFITLSQFRKIADVRFENGATIEPHRNLQPGQAKQGK